MAACSAPARTRDALMLCRQHGNGRGTRSPEPNPINAKAPVRHPLRGPERSLARRRNHRTPDPRRPRRIRNASHSPNPRQRRRRVLPHHGRHPCDQRHDTRHPLRPEPAAPLERPRIAGRRRRLQRHCRNRHRRDAVLTDPRTASPRLRHLRRRLRPRRQLRISGVRPGRRSRRELRLQAAAKATR